MTKTMTESLKIPFFGFTDEVDITDLLQLRASLKKQYPEITPLSFFIKAASLAMLDHPKINTIVSDKLGPDGLIKEYTVRGEHNFSIAIDSKDGLTVPNIKWVQEKSLIEISRELKQMQEKAKTGKFTKADFEDATFSISSVGNIGGTGFVPTILPPQAAIMAIGKARKMPKYVEEAEGGYRWDPADVMNISFSADHRVLDGATVLRWCQAYKGYLQNPSSMLINMR